MTSDISTHIYESIFVPAMEAELTLDQLAIETEQSIISGDSVIKALRDCLHEGRSVSTAAFQTMLSEAQTHADAATQELGRRDRWSVGSAVRSIRSADTKADIRSFTDRFKVGSDPRRVVGLHYIAARGKDVASTEVRSVRSRRVGNMLLGLGLDAKDRLISQRMLLTPGILRTTATAGIGLYTGNLTTAGVGLHIDYKHPLEEYPDEITQSSYLQAVSKYWILGKVAKDYSPTAAKLFPGEYDPMIRRPLEHLPEAQRPIFVAAAEEIEEARTANWYRNFERAREERMRQDESNSYPSVTPEVQVVDTLQSIITSVENDGCASTLQLMDRALVSDTVQSIRDARVGNPDLTDRQIYTMFAGRLQEGFSNTEQTRRDQLTDTVTVMGLLLGGKVSKDAAFPRAI